MTRFLHPAACTEVGSIGLFGERFAEDQPDPSGDTVVQGLDLTDAPETTILLGRQWEGVTFLGCQMIETAELHVISVGATVFPPFEHLPYNPYRATLYSTTELTDDDLDERIYTHQAQYRRSEAMPILEALAQRIHDHAVDAALADYLRHFDSVVAIMGGHSLLRDDPTYLRVAELACALTRAGHHIVTGGGPGAMEAANLGAWLAPRADEALADSVELLSEAADYSTTGYLDAALAVIARYPNGAKSLAIPTWFYGHEPTNAFASAVAKYFSNSIREDGLLAIASHGVVYTPGSAGTVQEVFMDATQNHYRTFEIISPMVFLDSEYWADDRLSAPRLLGQLAGNRPYGEMIAVLDDPADIVTFIEAHPPVHP